MKVPMVSSNWSNCARVSSASVTDYASDSDQRHGIDSE